MYETRSHSKFSVKLTSSVKTLIRRILTQKLREINIPISVEKLRKMRSTSFRKNQQFFPSNQRFTNTVWKNTLKCYQGEKISVKPHNKNERNLTL